MGEAVKEGMVAQLPFCTVLTLADGKILVFGSDDQKYVKIFEKVFEKEIALSELRKKGGEPKPPS